MLPLVGYYLVPSTQPWNRVHVSNIELVSRLFMHLCFTIIIKEEEARNLRGGVWEELEERKGMKGKQCILIKKEKSS